MDQRAMKTNIIGNIKIGHVLKWGAMSNDRLIEALEIEAERNTKAETTDEAETITKAHKTFFE